MILQRLIENLPHLLAIVVLTACSGFMSASETALFALSRQQLAALRGAPGLIPRLILQLRERPAELLSTILFVNTAVNILLYSMIAVTTARLTAGSGLWSTLVGGGAFLGVVLFAELLPKLVAFVNSQQLAPLAAGPLRVLELATGPLRWFVDKALVMPLARIFSPATPLESAIQPVELQNLISAARSSGLIDEREDAMLQQLMRLSGSQVRHVMIPRVDVVAFDLAGDSGELLELIRANRLLRIPVFENNIDNIRGIVLAREFLLNRSRPIRSLIRPVHFIPEQASVEALLQHFRSTDTQLAMVVDEYGGLAGVVAMEDLVEEIVGELHAPDERFPLPPVRRLDETTYLIDAGLDLDDFRRAFELPIENSRVSTVGGLITQELNRVPVAGDQIRIGPAALEVTNMRRRRVLMVRLRLERPPLPSPELNRLMAGTAAEPPPADASCRSQT